MFKINVFFSLAVFMFSSIVLASGADEDYDDLHKLTSGKTAVDDVKQKTLTDRAFEALKEEMFPTSTEQLRKTKEEAERLGNVKYENHSPEALTDIIQVSTRPGSKPSVVYVSPQHTTTLNFIDSTGQPWPITSVMYGNDADYKIASVDGHTYKNIIRIDPLRSVGSINVNISFADLFTTVTIKVENKKDFYHPSPIMQIDQEGPQAKARPIYSINNLSSDNILKEIVLGITPAGFKKMNTSDPGIEAWVHKNDLYIRTVYIPSSPLPRAAYHGPANFAAYRLSDMPILILTTPDGFEKTVSIMEPESNE